MAVNASPIAKESSVAVMSRAIVRRRAFARVDRLLACWGCLSLVALLPDDRRCVTGDRSTAVERAVLDALLDKVVGVTGRCCSCAI